jgi:hypothetical protein
MSTATSSDPLSDPEIAAAVSGNFSAPTEDAANDPEIAAALKMRSADTINRAPLTIGDAASGVLSTIGNSMLNIPHSAAHAAVDAYRYVTGGDANAPDPEIVRNIEVKPDIYQQKLLQNIPKSVTDTARKTKEAIDTVAYGDLGIKDATRLIGDAANLAPVVGLAGGVARKVAGSLAADTALPDAQAVVDNSLSGQSMGAKAAAPNIAATSPELKTAISEAAQKTGGAVNPDVLKAHLEADQHGIQLMKGQATRDPEQFTAEQNSTHPDIVKRINQQNGQMVDAIDNVRREASPTHVANSARENGQAVLDDLKDFDEPRKQAIKEAYKSANDANVAAGKGTLKLDPKPGVEAATQALEDREELLPGPGRSILQKMRDAAQNNGQIPLKQVETWKTIIADETRKADRAADGSAVKALGDLRDSVEQMSPGSDAAAGVKEKFDAARMLAKQRFDDMDADPAYKAAVTDSVKKGQPSSLADTFLDDYALNRGAPKSQVDLMMSKLSDEGKGAVASHTLSAIRKSAVNANGNVLPNGYNTAMAKYADKLPSLVQPETIDSLQSLGRTITNAKVEPAGGKVNYSRSGVVVRDALQGAAEHALNATTKGIYGVAKKALDIKGKAFAKDALAPGAGLDQLKTKP